MSDDIQAVLDQIEKLQEADRIARENSNVMVQQNIAREVELLSKRHGALIREQQEHATYLRNK